MQIVTAEFVSGKKVLLRYDLDVPIENGQVMDDFRLKAGLPTLKLCLEHASQVILMGHVGRPNGEDPKFSVAPIYQWFMGQDNLRSHMESGKLKLLENLRFEEGESFDSAQDLRDENINFAKELAALGDVYVNEAFAAYRKAASTTVLPTLLPQAAGLNFAKEVRILGELRDNPKKPLIVIMGGAKVQDKLPVIQVMAKIADKVLVGGKLVKEIKDLNMSVPSNAELGELTENGLDILEESIRGWREEIKGAKMIVWNGPMGRIEEEETLGTMLLAQIILESEAEVIVGGGDTVGFLKTAGLLEKFEQKGLPAGRQGFVSSGGGAMLKFLSEGTLPAIEVLGLIDSKY